MANTVLYKIYEPKDETKEDQFFNTCVMNSWELTCFLDEEIQKGNIIKQNLEDSGAEEGDDPRDFSIDMVFQILANNNDYEGGKTYLIEQFEQQIEDEDCYD